MKTFISIILPLLGLTAFAAIEIYLFDYTSVTRWIPWTGFLVVFFIGLYFTGSIQGMFPAKVNPPVNTPPTETSVVVVATSVPVKDSTATESNSNAV